MFNKKEKIYKNIEKLIRSSFVGGTNDISERPECKDENGDVDVFKVVRQPDFKFKSEFLVRSRCFWSIDHFLSYIKNEIDKA